MDWIAHYKKVKKRIADAATDFERRELEKSQPPKKLSRYERRIELLFSGYEETSPSRKILIETARNHGMTLAEMKSKSRTKRYVYARQEAMYLLRQEGLSLLQIGNILGGLDHTTVLHGIGAYKKRMIDND